MTDVTKTRLRHSAKIKLIEFLRPGGYCPQPYSIEMAFQAMRWLIASGVGYSTQHTWHKTSITSLLGGASDDHSYPKPVESIKDLLHRFHSAVLSDERYAPEIGKWREDKGITAYAELDMRFLHYKPMAKVPHLSFDCESDIQKALNSLFIDAVGKRTAVSLNSIHHKAQVIHKVDVTISPTAFYITLRYGFFSPEAMKEKGDSEWQYTLASTQPATGTNHRLPEPFLDTLRRALDQYAFVMDPKNAHLMLHLHEKTFVDRKADPHWGILPEETEGDNVSVTA